MNRDLTALSAGTFFVVVGALYMGERFGWWDLKPALIWPLLLIGLGVALVVGAVARASDRDDF